jgi:2-deoxy-D-gluconate 3-dehydrogenase
MIHLAKELALEWAKYNIRVNVVSPTFIISGKNKDLLESAHSKKEYLGKIPLKKYARPQDISAAITFLESGEADMITGQNLILDGGWTIS